MPLHATDPFGTIQIWVVIMTLATEDLPSIKAGGFGFHVPFSKECSGVSAGLKGFGPGGAFGIQHAGKVHDSIFVTVQACHHRGSGWSTDAVATKAVLKKHSLSSQTVQVRRWRQFQARVIGGDGLSGEIITEKENDIGAFVGLQQRRNPNIHQQEAGGQAEQGR